MIFSFLLSIYEVFTYFLAPPFCLFCTENLEKRAAFCQSCALQVYPIVSFDFYCGKDKTIKIFAVSAYKDPIKFLILAKHTNNETYIRLLSDFVVQQPVIDDLDFDMIVYIPLHWTRYASRGFNQAEIIAQAISQKTGKFVVPLLIRSKQTKFQARLSVDARQRNVEGAFEIDFKFAQLIAGKKILLVDDLFTTGSTIKSAADILFPYQPKKIETLVVCRVTPS